MASRGLMKRLIHHGDDTQSMSEHIQAITWAIQSFVVRFFQYPGWGSIG
jgi:hypothetical protein